MKNFFFIVLIFGLLLSFALQSCNTCKTVVEKDYVRDTTWIKETVTVRDTVIVTPEAKVSVVIPLEDIKPNQKIKRKSGHATITLSKDTANVLSAVAECDSLAIALELFDKNKEIFNKTEKIKEKVVYKTTKKTPVFVKVLATFGGITFLLLLLWFGYRIYKLFIR